MTVPCQKDAWNKLYNSQSRPWKGTIRNETPFPFGKGDKVMDIGCGNGKTSSVLIEEGYEVIGIDISEAAAEACLKMHGNRMRVECASADSLPLEDGHADGIVMIHLLEHLTADEMMTAVKEAHRVIRKGGMVFVRVFHKDDMRSEKGEKTDDGTVVRGNGIRYRYFDEAELRHLFANFRELSVKRIDERTKFKGTRSRIEAVFEKLA